MGRENYIIRKDPYDPREAPVTKLPSVYRYLDYRRYFADTFEALRTENRRFSYRGFARLAGSTSPNFLQLILARKLNVGHSAVTALSAAFELSSKEEAYLETIVAFDHAKSHEEKDKYFRRILQTREYEGIQELRKRQYAYFSHWYVPVVRELVVLEEYSGDPEWIAERIIPEISPSKAHKAVELLQSLGLIKWDADRKRFTQVRKSVSTPSEVLSVAITKYHKDLIRLGRESIERFGPDERDIRSVTLGLSREGYEELKRRQEAFWKEILDFAQSREGTDRVYEMNMQLFPVTGRGKKGLK